MCAAETGFTLAVNPEVVRAPGVAFVRQERVDAVGDQEGYWPGAPDVVVEVVSPTDVYADLEAKVFDWLDAGARLVVVVNPSMRSATIYRSRRQVVVLTETDTFDGDIIPAFQLPLR